MSSTTGISSTSASLNLYPDLSSQPLASSGEAAPAKKAAQAAAAQGAAAAAARAAGGALPPEALTTGASSGYEVPADLKGKEYLFNPQLNLKTKIYGVAEMYNISFYLVGVAAIALFGGAILLWLAKTAGVSLAGKVIVALGVGAVAYQLAQSGKTTYKLFKTESKTSFEKKALAFAISKKDYHAMRYLMQNNVPCVETNIASIDESVISKELKGVLRQFEQAALQAKPVLAINLQ